MDSSEAKHAQPSSVGSWNPENQKKRRKVNHACVYCRRSHMTCDEGRPCSRCLKRSIGHLCHDEAKDQAFVQIKIEPATLELSQLTAKSPAINPPGTSVLKAEASSTVSPNLACALKNKDVSFTAEPGDEDLRSKTVNYVDPLACLNVPNSRSSAFLEGDADLQHIYAHLFNASDFGDEFGVLNDFLTASLVDKASGQDEKGQQDVGSQDRKSIDIVDDQTRSSHTIPIHQAFKPGMPNTVSTTVDSVPEAMIFSSIKDDERVYMNIADPLGNDNPGERMKRLLEAKFAAGHLRPFNYVRGYTRLIRYLESHMNSKSRQRMVHQIDKFRPKFRQKMQSLTDMELTMVEMWFEKTLMEYDRVFASLPIAACCWRRTGEIFRGNKALAELICVPVDRLRDGHIALHEIMAEDDLVSYWDNFIAIAFDNSQKGMLTSCTLRSQDPEAPVKEFKCCFSFTIRRDAQHNIKPFSHHWKLFAANNKTWNAIVSSPPIIYPATNKSPRAIGTIIVREPSPCVTT